MKDRNAACTIRYAEVTVAEPEVLLKVLRAIADTTGSRIICFDADKLAGRAHAEAALCHARRSFAAGEAISHTFEMEALLYAAGSRQCSTAITFGLHKGGNHLYVCCCPAPEGIWGLLSAHLEFRTDPGDDLSPAKAARLRDLFAISSEELAATGEKRLQDLVLERVALLDVIK
jgi:KEOPS complex subunit Cgi121